MVLNTQQIVIQLHEQWPQDARDVFMSLASPTIDSGAGPLSLSCPIVLLKCFLMSSNLKNERNSGGRVKIKGRP